MNLDDMTKPELISIWEEACKKLGFFNFMTVSVDDVKQEFQERADDAEDALIPSDEVIRRALSYVRRKHDASEWLFIVEWAMEVAQNIETENEAETYDEFGVNTKNSFNTDPQKARV